MVEEEPGGDLSTQNDNEIEKEADGLLFFILSNLNRNRAGSGIALPLPWYSFRLKAIFNYRYKIFSNIPCLISMGLKERDALSGDYACH